MSEHGEDGFSEPALHGRPVPWMQELPKPSRRRFVLGTAAAGVVAAGTGVTIGWLTSSGQSSPADALAPQVPAQLPAALAAERELLATVEAALQSATGPTKQVLRAIRGDHRTHLEALQAALSADAFPAPASTSPASASGTPPRSANGSASSPPKPAAPTADEVRTAERRAAKAAAARALALSGRDAGLLASIAASEACHAELLA